jgi:hypothetical protein
VTITVEAPYGATQTEDGRFYIFNEGTDREERFRSVTAPLGRWDKDGLVAWSGTLAAKAALENLPTLVRALLTPECGRSYSTCKDHDWQVKCELCRCEKCPPCVVRFLRDRHVAESSRRSDEGGRVHAVISHWSKTGFWMPVDEDIKVYVDAIQRFIADHNLKPEDWEMAEATVINREYGYAGTLDAIVHFRREQSQASADLLDRLTKDGQERREHALGMVDYKSREKAERAIFLDMPLQLAGYRFAPVLRLADGTELPMPQVDFAAIIQIRPDLAQMCLVLAEEPEFAAFLNLLGADQWALKRGKEAIAANTFSYAPSVARARANDAARRRAAAKKEAALAAASEWVEPPVASEPQAPSTPPAAPGTGSAAEKGARAARAATATRAAGGPLAWVDLAQAHAPTRASGQRQRGTGGRKVTTIEASVLGSAGAQSEEPPF